MKRIPWNKGLNKNTSEIIKNQCGKIGNSLKGRSLGIAESTDKELERRKKISDTMKKNPLSGGLRKGSGRGIKGWYNNIWCDSTWELSFILYQLDNKIDVKRNTKGFEYSFKGIFFKYYPDFIIDSVFYEIKGRRSYDDLDEKNKNKINQFKGGILKVFYDSDMKFYIDYAENKYGKEFHKILYKKEA